MVQHGVQTAKLAPPAATLRAVWTIARQGPNPDDDDYQAAFTHNWLVTESSMRDVVLTLLAEWCSDLVDNDPEWLETYRLYIAELAPDKALRTLTSVAIDPRLQAQTH